MEITLEGGFGRSAEPIDLKIGLNMRNYVIHVGKDQFPKFEWQVANLCNLRLFANKLVCTVLTDLILLKIDIHVRFTMIHV